MRGTESGQPVFDESATAKPVEVLIEEAWSRTRRRRRVIAAIVAATITVAAIGVTAALAGGGPTNRVVAADPPVGALSFGVFEPARGRIVYPMNGGLMAIDPTDPTSVNELDLPSDLRMPTPAGWSADGMRLALASEYSGQNSVMDADGSVVQVPGGGCCWFVTSPWLSPDGTATMEFVGEEGDQLRVDDLEQAHPPRVVELDPPIGNRDTGRVPVAAWSPDGARIAYTAYQDAGRDLVPSVYVVDLDTGATRQLLQAGFGHIRQMSWSPDGSQILVIAGPWTQSNPEPIGLNPLTRAMETGLYLIGAESVTATDATSALQPIASGHYVAAAWSPTGSQIAAIDFAPSGRRLLVIMNADGSAPSILTELPADDLFTGLAWHPGRIGN